MLGQAKWDEKEEAESKGNVFRQLLLVFKELDSLAFFLLYLFMVCR